MQLFHIETPQFPLSCRTHKNTQPLSSHTHTHTHSLSLSHTHTHTLSLSHNMSDPALYSFSNKTKRDWYTQSNSKTAGRQAGARFNEVQNPISQSKRNKGEEEGPHCLQENRQKLPSTKQKCKFARKKGCYEINQTKKEVCVCVCGGGCSSNSPLQTKQNLSKVPNQVNKKRPASTMQWLIQ